MAESEDLVRTLRSTDCAAISNEPRSGEARRVSKCLSILKFIPHSDTCVMSIEGGAHRAVFFYDGE